MKLFNKNLIDIYAQRAVLCAVVGICYAVAAPPIGHLPHLNWFEATCAFWVISETIGAIKQ